MNWRLKSLVQRTCAHLPIASEAAYYGLQRAFGSLRNPTPPWEMFLAAADLVHWLGESGISVQDARVMEVGTGRRIDLPLGLFLCGADSVDTFDLHPYLKPKLVGGTIDFIRKDREKVAQIFSGVANPEDVMKRIDVLCSAANVADMMDAANIRYHAPADAAHPGLPRGSIDIHISYTVFEHIPGKIIRNIELGGRRTLAPNGVLLHHIDPSDHFAHEDHSIPAINFLQFSDEQWKRYASNQFAYHNRLRAEEYRRIFDECGYEIIRADEFVDPKALETLKSGFPLDEQFRGMDPAVLACTVCRYLARPRAA